MTMSNVRAGFKVTGVHPLNRKAALMQFFTSPSDTRFGYQPMLSPIPRKKKEAVEDDYSSMGAANSEAAHVPTTHDSTLDGIQHASMPLCSSEDDDSDDMPE